MKFQIDLGNAFGGMGRVVEFRRNRIERDNVFAGRMPGSRRRRSRLERQANFGQMLDELRIEPRLAAPSQHIRVEEVPA